MANGHGGARIGAGQKKKALSERIVEGNPGKRKLTVMEFTDTVDLQGETMPPQSQVDILKRLSRLEYEVFKK